MRCRHCGMKLEHLSEMPDCPNGPQHEFPTAADEIIAAMKEVDAAIEKVDNWTRHLVPTGGNDNVDARGWMGSAAGWVIAVFDFDIEPQGFPKGSRGYDGSARKENTVYRLTRGQAERAVKRALEEK